jgi:UDP-N-acetylglucosamine 2-epimerase (hydrolysing)
MSSHLDTQKSLLFITGTRADYGKLEPLAIAARDAGFAITFFVTGMHLMRRYGTTANEVHRFQGASIHEFINQADGDPHDLILAKTIMGFSDWVKEYPPDLVIVHGDRVEAIATALVCATNYIPCAHVEGGEVSGTIDELYRHCVSKLCRYHFVSSDKARQRVLKLGEAGADVFPIGSPELDIHKAPSGVSLQDVKAYYDIPYDDYGIVVFHPVTSERDTIHLQASALFAELEGSGRNFVVVSPNNDPGSDQIFKVIETVPAARFRHIPSLRFAYFSELLRNASAVIGNSSMGVREAPFLGIPSLNIGTRQLNRSEAPSVVHCQGTDRPEIAAFLRDHWGKRGRPDKSFGSGNAAQRFVEILKRPDFWVRPLQKEFHDN